MKPKYLFPFQFKKVGWVLFAFSMLILIFLVVVFKLGPDLFLYEKFFVNIQYNDIGGIKNVSISPTSHSKADEILSVLLIIGLLFIAFSREKKEDEYIEKIRLESLVWATYINYAILILALLFVYNLTFKYILSINMFTILVFFIIRFRWEINRLKKFLIDAK